MLESEPRSIMFYEEISTCNRAGRTPREHPCPAGRVNSVVAQMQASPYHVYDVKNSCRKENIPLDVVICVAPC